MMQCDAMCFSVLQCVAAFSNVLQYVVVFRNASRGFIHRHECMVH